jgi:hypothetical protein
MTPDPKAPETYQAASDKGANPMIAAIYARKSTEQGGVVDASAGQRRRI